MAIPSSCVKNVDSVSEPKSKIIKQAKIMNFL